MKKLLHFTFALFTYAAIAGTDIVPNPANPGTLGEPANQFPDAYATNFHGALQGNADTATTASNLAGTLALAQLPPATITNTIFGMGTNDISTLFNAFASIPNSRIDVWQPAGAWATNLYITAPGVRVDFHGTTLHKLFSASQLYWRTNQNWYQAAGTNFDFLVEAGGSKLLPNVSVENVIIDGGQPQDYRAYEAGLVASGAVKFYDGNAGSGMYPLGPSALYYGANAWTNSFGIIWNNNCGGYLQNVQVRNCGGVGFFIVGNGMTVPYSNGAGTRMMGCSGVSNCISLFSQAYEAPTNGLQTLYGNAEYLQLDSFSASKSAFGMVYGASNIQINNASLDGCYCGILLLGGSDDNAGPHTLINGLKLNHDDVGFLTAQDLDYLEIDGLYMAATTTNYIKRSTMKFVGGSMNFIGIYSSPGFTNKLVTFIGSDLYGIASYTNISVLIQDCTIRQKCLFDGCYLEDLNNTAPVGFFPWTTWNNDVISTNAMLGYISSGMPVNGAVQYNGNFSGSGSNLTSLNASSLGSGTVPAGRLATNSPSSNAIMTSPDGTNRAWAQTLPLSAIPSIVVTSYGSPVLDSLQLTNAQSSLLVSMICTNYNGTNALRFAFGSTNYYLLLP